MKFTYRVLLLLPILAALSPLAHADFIMVNFDESQNLSASGVTFYNGSNYVHDVNGPGNFNLTTGQTITFNAITNNTAALAAGEILFNAATSSGFTEFIANSYSYSSFTTPSGVFESFLYMNGTLSVNGSSSTASFSLTDLGNSGGGGFDTGTSTLIAASAPEPAGIFLLGTGVLGVAVTRYRRLLARA